MNEAKRVAVVTGANRGLGYETCKQLAQKGLQVVLTSRDESGGRTAADALRKEELEVVYHPLDVTDPEDIERLASFVREKFGRLDVLVNNAGIAPDLSESLSAFDANLDIVRETMETNVYGPLMLCRSLIPLMKKNDYGRVVNLSSAMGRLTEMNGGYPAYRISKTAINVLTRMFADELEGSNIIINSADPGWVKTDMGGKNAPTPPEQGVDTIVWLATLPDGGPSGGFFRDREPTKW